MILICSQCWELLVKIFFFCSWLHKQGNEHEKQLSSKQWLKLITKVFLNVRWILINQNRKKNAASSSVTHFQKHVWLQSEKKVTISNHYFNHHRCHQLNLSTSFSHDSYLIGYQHFEGHNMFFNKLNFLTEAILSKSLFSNQPAKPILVLLVCFQFIFTFYL